MEASHLTLAHDHARAASNATQTSDTTVAVSEHTLAAGEFAKAAATTASHEALRTLKLLEQHHQKLSELLRLPEEAVRTVHDQEALEDTETSTEQVAQADSRRTKNDATLLAHPRRVPASASSDSTPRRVLNRETSSSIASNLASARGIKTSHNRRALSPSVTTRQAPGTLEIPPRRSAQSKVSVIPDHVAGKPSWLPPVTEASTVEAKVSPSRAERIAAPVTSSIDEGFQRWTSTFGHLMSKISPALAFTGLPLVGDEPVVTETKERLSKQSRSAMDKSAHVEPDLNKLFSKSAMRSLHHANSGADSFYVVPTAGHTVSYANILSFAEKEKRRMAASIHSTGGGSFEDADNEDFVDARESFAAPSASLQRNGRKARSTPKLENVVEELYTENKSLKDCVDKLSRRLHTFEMAAQSSGLAMQESMRLSRPPSPVIHRANSAPQEPSGMQAELQALKEQIEQGKKEFERMSRENEKLNTVIKRYRERWEKLKEGAKTRRSEGAGSKDSKADDSSSRFVAG